MARPSKLTEQQWHDAYTRIMAGETLRAVAKDYGITPSAIQMRVSDKNKKLKTVAKQIVDTEQALSDLPVFEQIAARRLADDMRDIAGNLARAGRIGAKVARSMMAIAEKQTAKINHDDPMESADILQGIAAVGRVANESSTIGLKMLSTATRTQQDDEKQTGNAPVSVRIIGRRHRNT